jgi:hypothetical protein
MAAFSGEMAAARGLGTGPIMAAGAARLAVAVAYKGRLQDLQDRVKSMIRADQAVDSQRRRPRGVPFDAPLCTRGYGNEDRSGKTRPRPEENQGRDRRFYWSLP